MRKGKHERMSFDDSRQSLSKRTPASSSEVTFVLSGFNTKCAAETMQKGTSSRETYTLPATKIAFKIARAPRGS